MLTDRREVREQVLATGSQVEMLPEVARLLEPLIRSLRTLIEEGQARGVIREGDPLLLTMSVMAQPLYFMLVTRRTPPDMLPIDPGSREGRQACVDHMAGFALRGLLPDGPGGGTAS